MNAKKMRKTIVAGNWKMNASKDSVESLVTDILSGASDVSAEIIVCAPFPYLSQVEGLIEGSNLIEQYTTDYRLHTGHGRLLIRWSKCLCFASPAEFIDRTTGRAQLLDSRRGAVDGSSSTLPVLLSFLFLPCL